MFNTQTVPWLLLHAFSYIQEQRAKNGKEREAAVGPGKGKEHIYHKASVTL